jgi:tRNA pseudouridine synthase 10
MADGVTIGDGSVQASLEAVILKCLRADGAKLNSAGGALMTST